MAGARAQMLGAAVELGIPDAIGKGSATAEEIAKRLSLEADSVHRVLRAMATDGWVRLDAAGRFRLTRYGALLCEDHPGSWRAWIRYLNLPSTRDAYGRLEETLRTGEPSFPLANGRSVWAHFAEHPHEEQLFATAMRRATTAVMPVLLRYRWPREGVVCDVAGGAGTLMAAVLRARPGLRGIVVDSRVVLDAADRHLRAEGVRDRVELLEGDMFARVDATADLYVLKDVLHDWDDERCARILGVVARAMPPAARLVVVESLLDRNQTDDEITAILDVHMLTQCDGGRQRSADELRALLRAAGLEPGAVRRTAGPDFVEASKPR